MRRTFFLLALFFIITSCTDKSIFFVEGVIIGGKGKTIYIKRLDIDTPVLVDSTKIGKNGSFRFKVRSSEVDFYQVGLSSADFITILAEPREKIKLSFKGNNLFEDYSVSGSPGSEKLKLLDYALTDTKRKLDSLTTIYNKALKEPVIDAKVSLLEAEYSNLVKEQRKKNIEFIINNITSLASIKALYQRISPDMYVLYDQHDLQYLKIVRDSLTHYYPKSKHVRALSQDFEKQMNEMYISQLEQMTNKIPQTKLDPDLKNISGKRIALSSLRGKYVLLAFWSVKSSSCVEENLQMKEFYKLYNKRGFEIYQINLDESESEWQTAVKFDELPWISTREDDPLNPVNAVIFNVKSLPANYLFDKEGNIIATNLHGRPLQLKLEQLFNK
jgi:peroxiredoxin